MLPPVSAEPTLEEDVALAIGLPRPMAAYDNPRRIEQGLPALLPVAWYATSPSHKNNWAGLDRRAQKLSHENGYTLCQVCGDTLGHYQVYGANDVYGHTSGPGMHPACALLAARFCPHIKEKEPAGKCAFYLTEGLECPIDPESIEEQVFVKGQPVPSLGECALTWGRFKKITLHELRQLVRSQKSAEGDKAEAILFSSMASQAAPSANR